MTIQIRPPKNPGAPSIVLGLIDINRSPAKAIGGVGLGEAGTHHSGYHYRWQCLGNDWIVQVPKPPLHLNC